MSVFRRFKRVILLFLIPVLILLIINSVANRHNHQISGYVYTHSHPFHDDARESPYQDHSHSRLELIIMDQLSNIEVLVSLVALSFIVFSQPKISQHPENVRLTTFFRPLCLPPRGPPRFV